jgi:3-oxoacyl-[acyl-carrier-protein] synthase-3
MSLRLAASAGVTIAGSGSAFPSDIGAGAVLSNHDVYRELLGPGADAELSARGLAPDHAREAWGVQRREWLRGAQREALDASADVTALAAQAARKALEAAALDAGQIDLLIAATATPARITSTMASAIAKRIGCGEDTACFDVRSGGTGGLVAWLTATRYLSSACSTALVVAAETPSLYLDRRDLATALLFGDGAGALVLRFESGAEAGLLGAVMGHVHADGRAFTVPGPLPPQADALADGAYAFQRPDAVYREALAGAWSQVCHDLKQDFPAVVDSIAHFLPYAVTAPQVRRAADALGVSTQQTYETLAQHGCLGCAGPLVSLDALRRNGSASRDQTVALAAVGGGISIAGMLWRL